MTKISRLKIQHCQYVARVLLLLTLLAHRAPSMLFNSLLTPCINHLLTYCATCTGCVCWKGPRRTNGIEKGLKDNESMKSSNGQTPGIAEQGGGHLLPPTLKDDGQPINNK